MSTSNNINTLITALALKQANRNGESEILLSDWMEKEPENKLARWSKEVYAGNKPDDELQGNENS